MSFLDEIMEIEVTGEQLWEALENGVSKYPGASYLSNGFVVTIPYKRM